jgi:ATP-dependent exoDNAse (exonuclease V) beta subunit
MQESGNFVVYKSSAGSGKTYTLVREYLKIVLHDPDLFRHVLAITFTNKAANEMKERVVRYLMALADDEKRRSDPAVRQMLPYLAEHLHLKEEHVCERAEKVLRLILHHYGEFSISTIDSFTHRVIRTFAHDLEIPMNFEVELESEEALRQAIDELIGLVGTEARITRLLIEFVEKKAGDELNWNVGNDLYEFSKALLNEDSLQYLSEVKKHDLDVFMEVKSKLIALSTAIEKKARESAGTMLASVNRIGLGHDDVSNKSRGVLSYLLNIHRERSELALQNSYARKSLETGEWLGSKADPAIRSAFESIKGELLKEGRDYIDFLQKEYPRYLIGRLLLNNLYATALLGAIEKNLDENLLEDNKVLISEFNRRISAVVREQPAPFIYERLGERYQHYLLDEFQDTSIMQWHNLLPLIENALASGRLNLVVGDAKQAIYRWRSGDARQFQMLPGLIRENPDPLLDSRERALRENYHSENLAMNHRSSPVIVDFNNRFFQDVIPLLPENNAGLYLSSEQVAAKKNKPGMVRIEVTRKDDPDGLNYSQQVLQKTSAIIEELREDGYSLKDIAILCRKNEKAAIIASHLIQQGISVISSESLLLTQSPAVNFLVAFARHLRIQNDPLPVAEILHFLVSKNYIAGVTFDSLWLERLSATKNPTDEIQPEFLPGFQNILEEYFPGFEYSQLRGFDLQALFRYLAVFFSLDLQEDSYLRFFMDYVMDFMKKNQGGISEFLEWWEGKSTKASLVIPEGIDAVRIMTVHRAKGLQFPAVIFPFADEEFRKTRKHLWVKLEEDLAEPLRVAYLPARESLSETEYAPILQEEKDLSVIDLVNVLYVALTRPEERLYVISKQFPAKTVGPVSVPKLILNFLQKQGLFEEGRQQYQFGERSGKESQAIAHPVQEQADDKLKGKAHLKMMLRKHAPDSWAMDEPEQNREWGTMVHDLMSEMNDIKDIPEIIGSLQRSGELTDEDASKLRKMARELLNDKEIMNLFSPGCEVRNEAEILTPEGKSYRPDRVMIRSGKVTIIDYKTGFQRDSHKKQVEDYASLLQQMNYVVESAYLLYLNETPVTVRVI